MRPPRTTAPLLAAAVAAGSLAAVPAAKAQFLGLQADGPAPVARPAAPAAAPATGGGWFGLRADEPAEPAEPTVRPVSHAVPQPAYVPQPGYVAHAPVADPATGGAFGLVADGPAAGYVGGVYGVHAGPHAPRPRPAAEPVYAPGGRQVAKKGHLWPPFPRPTGPKAGVATQFHHAHYWPLPYTCRDRAYVRGLAAMQASAGRAAHAAVHGYHFDPATHALTDAGREHLRVAVRAAHFAGSAPIAVDAAGSPEDSESRMDAVRVAVAELGAPHLGGNVRLSHEPAVGRPALEIDRLRKDEILSMPQPRIPVSVGTGAGALTGGG